MKSDTKGFGFIVGRLPRPEYTVTFVNWDDSVLKTEKILHGNSATPPVATRDGYTFTKWDKTFASIQSNLTIKAEFNINSYTITFNGGGGSGTMTAGTINHGGNYIIAGNMFTRDAYSFNGWIATGNKTGSFANGATITNITGDIILTAQWIVSTVPCPRCGSPLVQTGMRTWCDGCSDYIEYWEFVG